MQVGLLTGSFAMCHRKLGHSMLDKVEYVAF